MPTPSDNYCAHTRAPGGLILHGVFLWMLVHIQELTVFLLSVGLVVWLW